FVFWWFDSIRGIFRWKPCSSRLVDWGYGVSALTPSTHECMARWHNVGVLAVRIARFLRRLPGTNGGAKGLTRREVMQGSRGPSKGRVASRRRNLGGWAAY